MDAIVKLNDVEATSQCMACGDRLKSYSILICAECLYEESDNFNKLVDNILIKDDDEDH